MGRAIEGLFTRLLEYGRVSGSARLQDCERPCAIAMQSQARPRRAVGGRLAAMILRPRPPWLGASCKAARSLPAAADRLRPFPCLQNALSVYHALPRQASRVLRAALDCKSETHLTMMMMTTTTAVMTEKG